MSNNVFLFDWDGCLADTLPIWFQALRKGVDDFQIQATDSDIIAGLHDWTVFLDKELHNIEHFAKVVYDHVVSCVHDVKLNEGALHLLENCIDMGCHLAIVTSSHSQKVIPVLEKYGVKDRFKVIVGKEHVTNLKPHAEPLQLALSKLGASSDQAWMIGDSAADVLGGKAAGTGTIWYSSDSNKRFYPHLSEQSLKPDITVEHLCDIPDMILAEA